MMALAALAAMAVPPVAVADAAAAALAGIAACAAVGQQVSVAIVGPEGETRVVLRGDGAPPHSVEAARRKAYTAASFEQSTEALAALVATHADAAGLARLEGTLFVGGGLPVARAGRTIGGVGVAGATGPDERCARAAIARLTGSAP